MLLSESKQQTPYWSSPSASAQRFPVEDIHFSFKILQHIWIQKRAQTRCLTHMLFFLVNIMLLHVLLPFFLQAKAVLAHSEPVQIIGYTMVIDTDNTALTWWPFSSNQSCLLALLGSCFEFTHSSFKKCNREHAPLFILIQLPDGHTKEWQNIRAAATRSSRSS